MSQEKGPSRELDLQPDPRILPMLGEINLAQWRCLAELIDNSVDSFLHARDNGKPVATPEVSITVPTSDATGGKVVVRDNGPGMDPSTLEKAVRAGWTGNDPIQNLGMFGMGFNIATARLGAVTTVWTSRAGDKEEWGVVVDLDALRRQRHFRTPLLVRPKTDPGRQGTEISIEKLKPDQRQWLGTTSNRTRLQKELQRAYSAMLVKKGLPVAFSIQFNARTLAARPHCVWGGDGNAPRTVQTRLGPIDAFQNVDVTLPDRPFCVECWQWLPVQEAACPACGKTDTVTVRKRRVVGWLGIQRYLHETEFGVDLIRHGRKIEIANKDLFRWSSPDGQDELEYPIDDPRGRGRIVGEIHVDHCRVTYMKDRFDRSDPAWDEMVRIVRGDGPLRPDKAAELGIGENASPLFRLFQAFRRNSPKPKTAGSYARLLVVPDNDRAYELAQKFYAGEPQCQSDAEWWKLVEEADRALLKGTPGDAGEGEPPGFADAPAAPPATAPAPPTPAAPPPPPPPAREAIPSLSREYIDDATRQRWQVRAYSALANDPALEGPAPPWRLQRTPQGPWEFVVETDHSIFRSMTMTPLDGLLAELAHSASEFSRETATLAVPFATILASLRDRYGGPTKMDAEVLSSEARATLVSMARSLPKSLKAGEARAIFDTLTPSEREQIQSRMAARSIPGPQHVIDRGGFLEHATTSTLMRVVESFPELFFDGRYWADDYERLDYGTPAATDEAKSRVLGRYMSLLSDAAWLADQDPGDLTLASRARLQRAALALELLEPAANEEGAR